METNGTEEKSWRVQIVVMKNKLMKNMGTKNISCNKIENVEQNDNFNEM